MRTTLWAMIALTVLTLVSCTKEKSFETETGNPGGGTTDGDLLAKIVIQLGADSSTTSFTYDASKRLVSETNKGLLSVVGDDSLQRINRSAEGVIDRISVWPSSFLNTVFEYTVRYDGVSKRYTSKLSYDDLGHVEDSIVYNYSPSGKIVSAHLYADYGGGPELLGRDSMVYDGNNNIVKVITSEWENSDWSDLSEMTVEYDNRVNPLKLSEEAIVLERYQYYGNNNPTKITIVDYDVPTLNEEITLTYTYNVSDKPLTANIGIMGASGATLPAIFRYQ